VDIKLWFKAVDIVEHSCDVDFLVGAQHKKGVRAQRKVKRIRAQRKVKSLLLDMAEHVSRTAQDIGLVCGICCKQARLWPDLGPGRVLEVKCVGWWCSRSRI